MMSVETTFFEWIWVNWISWSHRQKVLCVNNYATLLQNSEWPLTSLNLYVPYKLVLVPLFKVRLPELLSSYILECLLCSLLFLGIKLSIAVLVELLRHHVVLTPHVSIPVKVITNVRDAFLSSLILQLCARLRLLLGLAWSWPPLGDPVILSQNVAAIVTWLLLDWEVPAEHINPWHLMLGWIKL